jgi:hypothetical protein
VNQKRQATFSFVARPPTRPPRASEPKHCCDLSLPFLFPKWSLPIHTLANSDQLLFSYRLFCLPLTIRSPHPLGTGLPVPGVANLAIAIPYRARQPCTNRILKNIAQHPYQMFTALNKKTLEPSLPNMTAASISAYGIDEHGSSVTTA